MRAFLLLASLVPWGCTTVTQSDLAKRDEYLAASAMLASGDARGALQALPAKEPGGFITSLERGWLSVLSGKPDTAPLLPIGRDLEDRKTLSASKEARSFFYKESEDGYFPAEHEAIALHLVTGFAFAELGRWDEAKVEARKAAFYLQNDFGSGPGFDDPALRFWLAALWASTGEWESARVDLRSAAKLNPTLTWANRLADEATPPSQLAITFVGPGPDVVWEPKDAELDRIRFVPGTDFVTVLQQDGKPAEGAGAAGWYTRHQERDRAIRQVLDKSRYMAEGVLPATAATATAVTGAAVGATVAVAGVVTGVGVAVAGIYLGIRIGGELGGYVAIAGIAGGVAVGKVGVSLGEGVIDTTQDASGALLDKGFNRTNSYRYVRFLPDFVLLGKQRLKERKPFAALKGGPTEVLAYFVPGTGGGAAAVSSAFKENRRSWVFEPRRMARADAERACAELPHVRGTSFRLPTWAELLDGEPGGLFDPKRNPAFARALFAGEFWLAEEGGALPGTCHFFDGKDKSQTPTRDCSVERAVVCLSGPPRR